MPFHTDYRPKDFDEVIGNKTAIKSLQLLLAKDNPPHAYLLHGQTGCVRGDTLIYDPVDKTNLTIKERWKRGKPFNVFSFSSDKTVVVQAQPPVQYLKARMFRVETSESTFYVTSEHRFLSSSGIYLSLKELNEKQYERVRLLSIGASSLKAQHQDERHYSKIIINSQGDCQNDSHFCDEQPPFSLEVFSKVDSLLTYVHEHTPGYLPSRYQEALLKYNLPYLESSLLSKMGFCCQDALSFHQCRSSFFSKIYKYFLHHKKVLRLLLFEKALTYIKNLFSYLASQLALEGSFSFSKFSCKFLSAFSFSNKVNSSNDSFRYATIKEITEVSQDNYYDFHVPIYNNYWAGGIFHHNCGKTTIARIIASELECSQHDFIEINAGNNRGIDTAREIIKNINYAPLAGKTKFILLDEAHKLTGDFQNALLKPLEDTPAHVYFILCTTDPQKLLPTIRNRCMMFEMRELNDKQMLKLIHRVVAEEEAKCQSDIITRIIDKADGCPRQALILLEQIINLSPKEQKKAIRIFKTQDEQIIDLCRALLNKDKWSEIAKLLKGIDEEPEKIRYAVLGYMTSVMLGSEKGDTQAAIVINNFKDTFYNTLRAGLTFACFKSVYK